MQLTVPKSIPFYLSSIPLYDLEISKHCWLDLVVKCLVFSDVARGVSVGGRGDVV